MISCKLWLSIEKPQNTLFIICHQLRLPSWAAVRSLRWWSLSQAISFCNHLSRIPFGCLVPFSPNIAMTPYQCFIWNLSQKLGTTDLPVVWYDRTSNALGNHTGAPRTVNTSSLTYMPAMPSPLNTVNLIFSATFTSLSMFCSVTNLLLKQNWYFVLLPVWLSRSYTTVWNKNLFYTLR